MCENVDFFEKKHLGDEGADFVVTESRLGKVVSDKIDFSSVSSMQGA